MEPHPFRQAFVDRDLDRLIGMLTEDAVFHSPVISGPGFRGRESIAVLFAIVFDVVTDVEYVHDLGDENAHILVANGRVLGKPVKTTTVLELDADRKISEIWAMARPLTGVAAIAEAVGSRLAERQRPGGGAAVRAISKPLAGVAAVTDRTGSRMIAGLNRSTS